MGTEARSVCTKEPAQTGLRQDWLDTEYLQQRPLGNQPFAQLLVLRGSPASDFALGLHFPRHCEKVCFAVSTAVLQCSSYSDLAYMTEFKWQTERWQASSQWQSVLSSLHQRVQKCQIARCTTNSPECISQCAQPLQELQQFVEQRTALYAQQGAKYCKTECWEAADLSACAHKCVQEYTLLFEDLKAAIVQRAEGTRFLE